MGRLIGGKHYTHCLQSNCHMFLPFIKCTQNGNKMIIIAINSHNMYIWPFWKPWAILNFKKISKIKPLIKKLQIIICNETNTFTLYWRSIMMPCQIFLLQMIWKQKLQNYSLFCYWATEHCINLNRFCQGQNHYNAKKNVFS